MKLFETLQRIHNLKLGDKIFLFYLTLLLRKLEF